MNDPISKLEERHKWLESLPDGIPCDHVGCLSHVSHPCEGCGRIGGRRLTPRAADCCQRCGSNNWRDAIVPDTLEICNVCGNSR